jgi:hypothetical protein
MPVFLNRQRDRTPQVRRGEAGYLGSLGVELQPALAAGDLLIHAGSLAHGGNSRGRWSHSGAAEFLVNRK